MMYRSSPDMQALVDRIGMKLNRVPATYVRRTGRPLPMAKMAVGWQQTFQEVHARFSRADYRHTSLEFGQIAELAQWLINLHCEMNNQPPKQLTIHEEAMVMRERIIG